MSFSGFDDLVWIGLGVGFGVDVADDAASAVSPEPWVSYLAWVLMCLEEDK